MGGLTEKIASEWIEWELSRVVNSRVTGKHGALDGRLAEGAPPVTPNRDARPGAQAPAPRETLLVVDSERDMRENIRRILRREPCQCLTAATGEEALAICKSTRVDLVLTDLRVPGTEVAALVREVRALSARAPVLIVTAYVGDDAIAKAMAAGARAVIAKPFTSAQLVTAVQEALKALRG